MKKMVKILSFLVFFGVIVSGCKNPVSEQPKNSNAYLSGLSVSVGSLSPIFNKSVMTYTVNVSNATTSIIVTGVKDDSGATVSSNNSQVTNLKVGNNEIRISVTAQDGVTTKEYIITIVRAETDILKEGSGSFSEGSYNVSIKQQYDSDLDVTQKSCIYSLTRVSDSTKCGFIIMKNIKSSGTTYQVYIGINSTNKIVADDYNYLYINGSSSLVTNPVEVIDPKADGSYSYYVIANISTNSLASLKEVNSLVVSLSGNKSITFTVPYDYIYFLTTYF